MRTAIVWDVEKPPSLEACGNLCILWNEWLPVPGARCICIPNVVEEHGEELRARYLEWIDGFGTHVIRGKSVSEQMEIRSDFSAWWMSLLVEKSPLKSPQITQVIKLFALEKILQDKTIQRIVLHTKDAGLAGCLRLFCERESLGFEWPGGRTARARTKWHVARAMSYLFHYAFKRRAFGFSKAPSCWKPGGIFFLDYLLNVRADSGGRIRFASHYWTELVDTLRAAKCRTNWLHLHFLSAAIPSFRRAEGLLTGFNREGTEAESHAGLDQFLGLRVIARALRDYLLIFVRTLALGRLVECFRPANSSLDFAPLMQEDWRDSTRGKTAMWNMLCLNLLEEAMTKLPAQKCGVYLQENMGWERAFVYCWRKGGHGKLIGFPHTFVRFWDLRYFPGPQRKNSVPSSLFPDIVAANGIWNRNALLAGGYGESTVKEAESLRYLFLGKPQKFHHPKKTSGSTVLLVCGDILPKANKTLLDWLEHALASINLKFTVIAKSHPAAKLDLSQYPLLAAEESNLPVCELASRSDFVITSNMTSAAVDAIGSGAKLIQILDGGTLNFSPLRRVSGVSFVHSAEELEKALKGIKEGVPVAPNEVFFLDPALPRWKTLLSLCAK